MSATFFACTAEDVAAAAPGPDVGRLAIPSQAAIASSNGLPYTPGIQNCLSPGEDTAATGACPVRRTGDSAPVMDTPCSGLSCDPVRSSSRPIHPEAPLSVTRPVSQKWREWKCERSGFE